MHRAKRNARRRNATFERLRGLAGAYPVDVMLSPECDAKTGTLITCAVYGVAGNVEEGFLLYGSMPLGRREIAGLNEEDANPFNSVPLYRVDFVRYGTGRKISCMPFHIPRVTGR